MSMTHARIGRFPMNAIFVRTCDFDVDEDELTALLDCDDNNPASTSAAEDADCDGIPTADDCDDTNDADAARAGDCDQDGIPTADDCDDSNELHYVQSFGRCRL